MKKKLVFVGNKPPIRETLANEIDLFDYVMRINRMNYLGTQAIGSMVCI